MRPFVLRVTEMAAVGGLIQVGCAGPDLEVAPGQVCLAWADQPAQPFLRVPLFLEPQAGGGAAFFVPVTHPYERLQPGDALDLLGPCGRGFRLPPGNSHLLVLASALERLLPTIRAASHRRLSVAVLTPRRAEALPEDVEIQRGPLTPELAAWADTILLDVADPRSRAQHIRSLIPARGEAFVQALVTPPMPCGTGACHACWVETAPAHRRRLACVEGPCFTF